MDYQSQDIVYRNFLLEQAYEQERMYNFIQEAILWTSGEMSIEKLDKINEGVIDSAKEKLQKAWEKIKEMVRKAINGFKNFFSTKENYLQKNKDLIVGKKIKYTEEIEMYPYDEGIKRIANSPIPPFDYSRVSKLNIDNYTNEVLHGYFKMNQLNCDKDELIDAAKDYFRGGDEKTYTAEQVNMTNIYNYCVDYKEKILKPLENDEKVIGDAAAKISKQLSIKDLKDDTPSTNNESVLFTPTTAYSEFFEKYFTEAEDEEMVDGAGAKQVTGDMTNKQSVNKVGTQVKNNAMKKGDVKGPTDVEKEGIKTTSQHSDVSKKCSEYTDTAMYLTTAKLAIAKEIYEFYWKIIKKHVASYGGQASDDTEGNAPVKTGTDYNNDLTPAAKEAQKDQKGIQSIDICYKTGNDQCNNSNNYIIRINYVDDQGDNKVMFQDVSSAYQTNETKNEKEGLDFVPGGITVSQEGKSKLWKISRHFKTKDGNKDVYKRMYIKLSKPEDNGDGFEEGNKPVEKTK